MLGRLWKQLASLYRNPDCLKFVGDPESSESSSSSTNSSNMPPRFQMPSKTYAATLLLGPGKSLGREDGSWEDVGYYFVQCRQDPKPLEHYYLDLSEAYGEPDGTSGRDPYNKDR